MKTARKREGRCEIKGKPRDPAAVPRHQTRSWRNDFLFSRVCRPRCRPECKRGSSGVDDPLRRLGEGNVIGMTALLSFDPRVHYYCKVTM